ncbi:DUF4124 domain-containing protein [Thiobacter aerophilum]|uniref:DUF4124 domain-containing protein n=1 Tax=Thiobacter aerophilum TaxID=3121275 RepID=A0ABV0EKT7_9BURK
MNKLWILLLLALPCVASGELYRWVDAQGKVHYSDSPPPADAKSGKTLPAPPSPASAPAGTTKSWQEKDMEFRQRRAAEAEAQAKKEKEAEEARQKQANCETARKNLRLLESGQRVVTTNDQGEREFLDDAARQKAINDARKGVETWCK